MPHLFPITETLVGKLIYIASRKDYLLTSNKFKDYSFKTPVMNRRCRSKLHENLTGISSSKASDIKPNSLRIIG